MKEFKEEDYVKFIWSRHSRLQYLFPIETRWLCKRSTRKLLIRWEKLNNPSFNEDEDFILSFPALSRFAPWWSTLGGGKAFICNPFDVVSIHKDLHKKFKRYERECNKMRKASLIIDKEIDYLICDQYNCN